MRTLDDALTKAQQGKSLDVAIKITLSFSGQDDVVLERDRIYRISPHEEEPYRQAAEVLLTNADGYFTDKALQGYKAVISYGLVTKAGKLYSNTAPLWVIAQELASAPGKLLCELKLVGIPNLLAEDRASESYIPDGTDTKTIKTLLTEIITAALSCYSHCPAYEVVFDSEDSLIDTYKPKDSFRIYTNGSRLAAIRRLIDHTHCMARFGADGKIHILEPTITGEVYDYEYSLETGHPFLSKIYRRALVIPNYISVKSQKDDDPQYSGCAKDDSYDSLPDKLKKHQYERCKLESDQQAQDIAEAILSKYQLNAELGSADALMNCGAELFDYVKVAAFCAEDTYRIGNLGSITRTYNAEKRIYNMRFSFGGWLNVRGLWSNLETYGGYASGFGALDSGEFERLYAKDAYIENLWIDQINAIWLDPDSNIDLSKIGDTLDGLADGELYARVKALHIDAGIIRLDENIFYKVGYDPTDKFDLGANDLDDIPEGTVYQRTKSAALTAAGLVLLDQVVVSTYGLVKRAYISAGRIILEEVSGDIDDLDDGSTYGKVKRTDISAGHIKLVVDQNLDAQGIEIVSSSSSTRIRINDNRIAGYKAGVLQFELRASDGRAYCGAGKVILDAGGVTIKGAKLILQTSGGGYSGVLQVNSSGELELDPWGYIVTKSIKPTTGSAWFLGTSSLPWMETHSKFFLTPTSGAFIFKTTQFATEGSIKIQGGGSGDIYIYSNGAWRTNT